MITGFNFINPTSYSADPSKSTLKCKFGDTLLVPAKFISATSVSCIVPAYEQVRFRYVTSTTRDLQDTNHSSCLNYFVLPSHLRHSSLNIPVAVSNDGGNFFSNPIIVRYLKDGFEPCSENLVLTTPSGTVNTFAGNRAGYRPGTYCSWIVNVPLTNGVPIPGYSLIWTAFKLTTGIPAFSQCVNTRCRYYY